MRVSKLRRIAIAVTIIGAIAALLVAWDRWQFEQRSKSVEITIDAQDLSDFARSYGYNEDELLREMRRSGLTSVAVYAEQGQHVNEGMHAYAQSGQQLVNAGRVGMLRDRGLQAMVDGHRVDPNSIYILVYDKPTLDRYLSVLRTQLEPKAVRVVRPVLPAIIAVKTHIDFFNGMDLGIPEDLASRVRRLGLLVDPRVQNNERLSPAKIDALFAQMVAGGRIGTVIFYGQRNEVLGYPYQLDATAAAFRAHPGINFGDVEAYTAEQVQKGTETLGRQVVGQTVRVMAIPKLQLDKLDVDTVIAEYLLGVRERNIRVIYLRPYPHIVQKTASDGSIVMESAEQANIDLLSRLRDALVSNGFTIGRATGFVDFKGAKLDVLYALVGLGAAGAFLLLLDLLGWSRLWMPWVFFGVTIAAFAAALPTGHGETVRKLWALGAALTFAVLAGLVPLNALRRNRGGILARPFADALRVLGAAAGIALVGGLYVTGLLSQAAFMVEIEQFVGVKALLVVPPLVVLAIYAFSATLGEGASVREISAAPVRAWMMAALFAGAAAIAFLLMRSGNQPDVGASSFELNLRGALTAIMGARPRFKEFLIGYPAMFLLTALTPQHRRAIGWALVVAAAVGLADVLDTFSHIHTPLAVGLLRTVNGIVVGTIVGAAAQWVYRQFVARRQRRSAAA